MKLVLSWFRVSLFEDSQFSIFLTSALAVLFRVCNIPVTHYQDSIVSKQSNIEFRYFR